jgi:hypothetical protein
MPKEKRPRVITKSPIHPQSIISKSAETDLPDAIFVRDNTQHIPSAETWDAMKVPEEFAVAGRQIEVGMYQLMKVLKVNGIVKISEVIPEEGR